jgi:hypothetical protein
MNKSTEQVLDALYAQAACLWGREDAERQRAALQQAADQIVEMSRYELPPDLEPRFFED